jgi:hypothetical protein
MSAVRRVIERWSPVQATAAEVSHNPGPETRMTIGRIIMSRVAHVWVLLLFAAATLASATEVHPGDQVRLIER